MTEQQGKSEGGAKSPLRVQSSSFSNFSKVRKTVSAGRKGFFDTLRRSLRFAEASSIRGRDDCSRVCRGGKERDIIPAADSGRAATRAPSQAAASHRAS